MDSSFSLPSRYAAAGRALIGSEVDDETKLAAILAEASSEVEPATSLTPGDDELASPLPAVMALRHAGIQARQGRPRVPKPTTNAANPRSAISLDSIPGVLAKKVSPTYSAHALDFRLCRLIAQRRRMMVRHEAKLLQFHGESPPGYRRFDEFARIEPGLSSLQETSRCWIEPGAIARSIPSQSHGPPVAIARSRRVSSTRFGACAQ